MSVWSGAGIPVIGGQVLSGAQTILFKGSRYLVEHPIVGMEGGTVENLGKPVARIEIHGIAYESGADKMLATLSGLIGSFQEVHVPSFNSGYYFISSGIGIMFENLKFVYDAGKGYPFYHYVIAGVLSGEVNIAFLSGVVGIDYTKDLAVVILGFTPFVDYSTNINVAILGFTPFVDYSTNINVAIQGTAPFISYTIASGV